MRLTSRARGRLDSHRQIGNFRGFGFCPFGRRVSCLWPTVTRVVIFQQPEALYAMVGNKLTTDLINWERNSFIPLIRSDQKPVCTGSYNISLVPGHRLFMHWEVA